MRELWRKIRWKIAYALAHEWIDDLENRLSTFLWLQTNGRMSKAYYTVDAMLSEANNCRMEECDECRAEVEE